MLLPELCTFNRIIGSNKILALIKTSSVSPPFRMDMITGKTFSSKTSEIEKG